MKFSFFVTSASVGGAQVFCSRLASHLSLDGHECHLVSGNYSSNSKAFERATGTAMGSAFTTHTVINTLSNSCSIIHDFLSFLQILLYLIFHRDNIIVTNSGKVSFIVRICCLLTLKPCFFVVHGWSYTGWQYRSVRFFYFLLEFLLEAFDFLVCTKIFVSSYDRKNRPIRFFNIFHRDFVVYNDCVDLAATSEEIPAISLPQNSLLNILAVARLTPQKNFEPLFHVLRCRPNFHLYIAGDGPDFGRLSLLATSLGVSQQISFLRELSICDLLPYYKSCDVFSLISFWEGFPISTIEAMSFSMPVVLSDVGGSSEVFQFEPFLPFGFLVPPDKSLPHLLAAFDSYASSNQLLYEHSRNSRLVYESHFSSDKQLKALVSILLSA